MSTINQHFVILSDGLGKWRKGDVVAASVMLDAGCDLERVLTLKAVRPATETEAGKAHVELLSPERHQSYDEQLAQKDKDIARLTARVAQLEEQIAAGTHLAPAGRTAPAVNESNLIEEKDRAIKSLEGRATVLSQELTAARAEAAAARTKLAEAVAESKAETKVEPKTDAKVETKAKVEPKTDPVPDSPGGPTRIRRVNNV